MPKELIAFLNFEFRKNMVSVKSVSGDTMTEVPRIAINWKEYQALLASVGVKSSVEERPLFRRYISYLSSEDLYTDLISFQAELRQALTAIVDTGVIPAEVWKRVFKDSNGLPMFIEPEGEGEWTFDNAHEMSFVYDFSADTYRLFMLALVRGLILNRRIFSLAVDGAGKFSLPEEAREPSGNIVPYSDAERRAALRVAVARDLPGALSRAVTENLPKALASSAAEKLPIVMDALVREQLPQVLAAAVEEKLPEALARAVAERLPVAPEAPVTPPPVLVEAEKTEDAVSIALRPVNPGCSLSVPGLRFIELDSSISVPASPLPHKPQELEPEPEVTEVEEEIPAPDFVFLNAAMEDEEEEPEDIEPEPLPEPASFSMAGEDDIPPPPEEPLDFNPVEYADSFQEGAVEEGFALFEVGGPAAERDQEQEEAVADDGYIFLPAQPEAVEPEDKGKEDDIEDIEPAESVPLSPDDEDEPLVLSERVETEEPVATAPEAAQEEVSAEEAAPLPQQALDEADDDEDVITPLPLENEEQNTEEGWLPFVKVPSRKKGGKLPLEQRLATLEQRRKRRAENDPQDTFDF